MSDSVPLWTIALQTLLPMWFSRQEYWSELRCPPSGALPHSGVEPTFLKSPELAGGFFTTSATWEAQKQTQRLSWWLSGKESACQYRRCGFDPWSRKIPPAVEQLRPCTTTIDPKNAMPCVNYMTFTSWWWGSMALLFIFAFWAKGEFHCNT